MEVKTNYAFRPVRCLEEDLEKQNIHFSNVKPPKSAAVPDNTNSGW